MMLAMMPALMTSARPAMPCTRHVYRPQNPRCTRRWAHCGCLHGRSDVPDLGQRPLTVLARMTTAEAVISPASRFSAF